MHDKPGKKVPGGQEGDPQGEKIMYKFYKKSFSNALTIMKRSAMPESVKEAIFSNEILRRLKASRRAQRAPQPSVA